MIKDRKNFDGWKVLIGCAIMMFVFGIIFNVTSIYIKPISEALSVSRTQVSTYITIMNFTMMIGCLLIGNIIKKLGIKKSMLLGATMIGIGTLILSISKNIMVFYVGAFFIGCGCAMSTTVPVLILINNWFVKSRGTIIAVIMTASTLGGVIFNPLGNYLIENLSWRTSYGVNSIIIFCITIPAIMLFIVDHPSKKGQIAYGAEALGNVGKEQATNKEGVTLKEAKSTSYFWIAAISLMIMGIQVGAMTSQLVPFLTDSGVSTTFAASAMSILLLSTTIGKPIAGVLVDKIGVHKGFMMGLAFLFSGYAVLNISVQPAMVVVVSILLGLGGFLNTLAPSLLTTRCFGNKDYDSIIGIMNVFGLFGAAMGPLIAGFMYDSLGSYSFIFKLCLIAMPVLMVLVSISIAKSDKAVKEQLEVKVQGL